MMITFLNRAMVFLFAASCGGKPDVSKMPQIDFYLESEYTGTSENYLLVDGTAASGLSYKLSGRDIEADVPLDREIPVQKRTKITYKQVGDYTLQVEFFKPDGTPLLKDSLRWSYSLETPDHPIIGLSEVATQDAQIVLLISESRDPGTDEIWIEGDLASEESPLGSWRMIPETSQVPLKLSEGDGLKKISVKLRNQFKIATAAKDLEILRKSQAPSDCKAELRGAGSNSRTLPIRIQAQDKARLFYRVFGDVEGLPTFQAFTSPATIETILSKGVGNKKLTVQIKDEAENYCLRQELNVAYSDQYQPEGLAIKNNLLWTDEEIVNVLPRIDRFADDRVEMFVHGDIVAEDDTFVWRPYQDEIQVKLAPLNGHRWVRIQYRVNGVESSFRHAPIYLKPFVYVQGSSSPYTLLLSNIQGLQSLSIVGCQQVYEAVSYSPSLSCTPQGSSGVQVHYDLVDGTRVSRSTSFNP